MADITYNSSAIKDKRRYTTVAKVTNILKEDVKLKFDGETTIFRAGKTYQMPVYLCEFYARKIAFRYALSLGKTQESKEFLVGMNLALGRKEEATKVTVPTEKVLEAQEDGSVKEVVVDENLKVQEGFELPDEQLDEGFEAVNEMPSVPEDETTTTDTNTDEEPKDLESLGKWELFEYAESLGIELTEDFKNSRLGKDERNELINQIISKQA